MATSQLRGIPMRHLSLIMLACIATTTLAGDRQEPLAAKVAALAETDPSAADDANDVAIWIHPTDPARSLVLGTAGTAGLELYGLDGHRVGHFGGGEFDNVEVLYDFDAGQGPEAIALAYDRRSGGLLALRIEPASLRVEPLMDRPLALNGEVTGLCGYHSRATGKHYVFASTDGGEAQQWEIYAKSGKVNGLLVRTIPVGVGAGYCVADEVTGDLYIAEEKAGIWRFAAEPETDAERSIVDLVAPRGHIEEEVSGLALYRVDDEKGYLIAADVEPARFNVYSLEDTAFLGAFELAASAGIDAVGESEGLAASAFSFGAKMPGGFFAVMDEDNDGSAGNFKLVAWRDIATPLGLASASSQDPRVAAAPSKIAPIEPVAETDPVDNYGDAADDPAIWVNPADPAKSLIVAAQKKRGIYVYGLDGKTKQVLPDGRMNNVDLRDGFLLGGKKVPIVAATNRTDKTLALYRIDPETGVLTDVADGKIPTGFADPYGLCMYRSPKGGDIFVFANNAGDGAYKQWRLVAKGNRVGVTLVREFVVGTQAEGCAADDEMGALYVAEEDVGLWRYSAEPKGGSARRQVDSTEKGHLEADVEGLSVYAGRSRTGFIVVSNQGANNYAVYRREGKNEFVGHFAVVANDELGIDGASETDGLDVTSAPLGPHFPDGLLVVQDGRNITPRERQNFKLVPWSSVVSGMKLMPPHP
jgi:3-phytase